MTINIIDIIDRVAPHAQGAYREAFRQGGPLLAQHGVTTPLRVAHFLAQALHETGGLTILRENMRYSAPRLMEIFGVGHHSAAVTTAEAYRLAGHPEEIAERVYGLGNPRKSRELGNTQPGDGFRFRGNGILQTTGRGAHRRMGQGCGIDFEGAPELVTAPAHALKPSLQEWTDNDLNRHADRNDIRTITRRINGGYNGIVDREVWLNRVWALVKTGIRPPSPWEEGDADDRVKWLQEALNDLGANPRLEVDGRYGPATRRAVRAFQAIAGLVVDGIAGPVTEAAIQLRLDTLR